MFRHGVIAFHGNQSAWLISIGLRAQIKPALHKAEISDYQLTALVVWDFCFKINQEMPKRLPLTPIGERVTGCVKEAGSNCNR